MSNHPWTLNDSEYVQYTNSSLASQGIRSKVKALPSRRGIPRFVLYDRVSGLSRYWSFKLQGLGFAKGLEFVSQRISSSYHIHLIRFWPGDIVYDVGANSGDLELYFRLHNIDIKYIGIEPAPEEFVSLSHNLKGVSTALCTNIALAESDGIIKDLYLSPDSGDNSLIKPPCYKSIHSVRTRRLDSLHKELFSSSKGIRLIKLEAEGYEPEICKGMEKILDVTEYISADLGWERGESLETTAPEVINFLLGKGFEILAIGRERLTVLFKNKKLAC